VLVAPCCPIRSHDINIYIYNIIITEGSLEVKLPIIWTDEEQRWEESEKRREEKDEKSEERRSSCAKR